MFRFNFCVTFVLLAILNFHVDNCSACNGYNLKLISIDNCGNNVLIIDKNFTVVLDKDCFLATNGCITTTGFTQAKDKFTIIKDGTELLSGHPDICNELDHKSKHQKEKLQMLGFPTECPVPAGRKCMDDTKKIDVSKFKNFLPMAAGQLTIHHDVTHDTGTTCVEIKVEISK